MVILFLSKLCKNARGALGAYHEWEGYGSHILVAIAELKHLDLLQ